MEMGRMIHITAVYTSLKVRIFYAKAYGDWLTPSRSTGKTSTFVGLWKKNNEWEIDHRVGPTTFQSCIVALPAFLLLQNTHGVVRHTNHCRILDGCIGIVRIYQFLFSCYASAGHLCSESFVIIYASQLRRNIFARATMSRLILEEIILWHNDNIKHVQVSRQYHIPTMILQAKMYAVEHEI